MYQCCPNIETSLLIYCANQLTGFYMGATLSLNGLTLKKTRENEPNNFSSYIVTQPQYIPFGTKAK